MCERSPRRGTTIIEVILTIGIVAILSTIGIVSLSGRRNQNDLERATREVAALLREAQSRAVARASSSAWGVHFENSTTSPSFAIFADAYASSSVAGVRPLPATVDFTTSSVSEGGVKDILFVSSTGMAAASTSVTIFLLQRPTQSSTISVASSGLVSF